VIEVWSTTCYLLDAAIAIGATVARTRGDERYRRAGHGAPYRRGLPLVVGSADGAREIGLDSGES
jgi:hypothetical protein